MVLKNTYRSTVLDVLSEYFNGKSFRLLLVFGYIDVPNEIFKKRLDEVAISLFSHQLRR